MSARPQSPPRSLHLARAVGLSLLTAALLSAPLHAQDLSGAVTVGGAPIPGDEVARALSECATHQPDLAPDTCLDRYFVPRWLLDAEARTRKLGEGPGPDHTLADILHVHLVERIAADLAPPSEADIDAYLKANSRDFEKPLRIRIFRILVAKKEEAQALIDKLSATTTIAEYRTLARAHSVDRATNERGGDLGFVWPNGSTDIPQVSAETSVYEAALKLEDGEFSKEPVVEGQRFAVVWRRGSLPAVAPTKQSRAIAAARLRERSTEKEVQKLLQADQGLVKGRASILLGKLRRKEATLFQEP